MTDETIHLNLATAPNPGPAEVGQPETDKIILMVDIESLDLGPRSVVTQIAMYGASADTEEVLEDNIVWSYLPIQPQLDLIHPRTISASTLWWWMQQEDDARMKFEKNIVDDFEALPVLMRHLTREFKRITDGRDYEVWAKGPQFDVTNIESLYHDCGMKAPWDYNKVRDLRTLMAEAGLHTADIPRPNHFIAHEAGWDCRYQLLCYFESRKNLRRR
mgnify:CR=1 FL=1